MAIKLNIGCGGAWNVDGWLGIDQSSTSDVWQASDEVRFIDLDVKKGLPFPTNSVDVVFSSHTLEHFTYEEGIALLFEVYRVLKIGAPLCLIVPDLDIYLSNYVNRDEAFLTTPEIIGGEPRGNLADNFLMNFYSDPRFNNTCHKYSYNFENLSHVLRLVGFEEVERVNFHEFSYYPELQGEEFRSPIKNIERFSLSVQCRKNSFNSEFRRHPSLVEALKYAQVGRDHQELAQRLATLLIVNDTLTAQKAQLAASAEQVRGEAALRSDQIAQLQAALQERTVECSQRIAELASQAEVVNQLQDDVHHHCETNARQAEELQALKTELEKRAQEVLKIEAASEERFVRIRTLETELSHQASLYNRRVDELIHLNAVVQKTFEAELAKRESQVRQIETGASQSQRSQHVPAKPKLTATALLNRADSYVRQDRLVARIAALGIFDSQWYLSEYPDVRDSGMNPLVHYLRFGGSEGRSPHPLFDGHWYLSQYQDVREAGINPLLHYVRFGAAEGRDPNPLFDTDWYLAEYPDVARSGTNPLAHFIREGAATGYDPHPLFDTNWYLTTYSDVRAAGMNPLTHYLEHGAGERRQPNPLFDRRWYLATYTDVAKAGMDPLMHYILFGANEDRNPSTLFNTKWYRDRNKLAVGGTNPLAHYLEQCKKEGRIPKPILNLATENQNLYYALTRSAAADELAQQFSETRYSPLISILLPTYNTPPRYLKEVIQSVREQTYKAWELCIVDDGSTQKDCIEILEQYAQEDPKIRIEFRTSNGGIAEASEQALHMATGEYVAFVDHDDVLAPNALSEVVGLLRQDPTAVMIYTDHAMMDEAGILRSPALKPAWSPEFFLSTNYIVHFKVVRRSAAIELGGFSDTIHVAQDIGMTCKLSDRNLKILHLPKILYYWRSHATSVASSTAAKPQIERAALQTYADCLARRGVKAKVVWPDHFRQGRRGAYKLEFPNTSDAKVAVVIPAINAELDPATVRGYLAGTDFSPIPDLHIISPDPVRLKVDQGVHFHLAQTQQDFDAAVRRIECDIIVFVSPTAKFVSSSWLRELVGYFSVSERIGAVGGKILDERLCVRSGGLLLLNRVFPISGGAADESDGYWLNNRIASNVEAVSSRLIATPKHLHDRLQGIRFFDHGDLAGVHFCLRLRTQGYRTVYTPWAKIVDPEPENLSAADDKLLKEFGAAARHDRYYHPFYSRDMPYALA